MLKYAILGYTYDMYLIVGLGNIGDKFTGTRHNLGFQVVDYLANKYGGAWQDKSKLHGQLAQVQINEESVILLKPTTFYNESGLSARAVQNFYKISNQNTLAIHDELALPFKTVRSRLDGSDAGNNGVKSLNSHLGVDYARIRVGISNELKDKVDDTDFVLGKFSKDEQSKIPEINEKIERLVQKFIKGEFAPDSHKL